MAIQSISGVQKTYQGSVPAAEPSGASYEKAAPVSVSPAEKSFSAEEVKRAPSVSQNADVQNDKSAKNGKNDKEGTVEMPGEKVLKKAEKEAAHDLANSEAIFGIHEKTNRVTIKIVDKETQEVLKEYPPEQTLDMIAKVWEIAGLMVDEKR